MSLLDPSFLNHALALLEDEAMKLVFRSTLGKVGAMFSNIWKSQQAAAEGTGDPDTIRLEELRSERVFDAAAGEISSQIGAGKFDAETASREASEPATREFVRRALESAVTSTSESKQMLLGRLIAQRLQTATDSKDDIALRRAVEVVGLITEHQLVLLAANVLVRYRLYTLPKIATRDAAEQVLRERFGPVARRLFTTGAWSPDDFESLSSLGVIRIPGNEYTPVGRIAPIDAIDTWITRNAIDPMDGVEGEVGSNDSHARFATRFPTIMTLKAVASNRIVDPKTAIMHGWRTDFVNPSPVGERLGEIVLDQLIAAAATAVT